MRGLRVIFLNVFLSIFAIAVTSIAIWLDRFIPFQLPFSLTFLVWPLLILGGLLIFWAFATLVRHSGATGAPGDPTKKLVTIGPYAWLRNPIYAGDALIILGLAFLTRSPSMLLFTFIFIFGIDLHIRLIEEPSNERRFGEKYKIYKQNVSRWLSKSTRRKEQR